jgi:hypothetical protein
MAIVFVNEEDDDDDELSSSMNAGTHCPKPFERTLEALSFEFNYVFNATGDIQ